MIVYNWSIINIRGKNTIFFILSEYLRIIETFSLGSFIPARMLETFWAGPTWAQTYFNVFMTVLGRTLGKTELINRDIEIFLPSSAVPSSTVFFFFFFFFVFCFFFPVSYNNWRWKIRIIVFLIKENRQWYNGGREFKSLFFL